MTKSQNTKSEQLTEQWKQGALPNGWYWAQGIKSEGIYAYTAEYLNNMYRPINGEIIIEQVPSYEEWQASETSIAYNELLEENTKLKELLRECRPALVRFVSYDDSEENERIFLMNKINEVLK